MEGERNTPDAVVYEREGSRITRKNASVFGPGDLYCSIELEQPQYWLVRRPCGPKGSVKLAQFTWCVSSNTPIQSS